MRNLQKLSPQRVANANRVSNILSNANKVRNNTEKDSKCKTGFATSPKNVALFPSRAKPGLTRSLGNQKRQKSKTNPQKNEKVTKQMHLGKHSNYSDISGGKKLEKSGPQFGNLVVMESPRTSSFGNMSGKKNGINKFWLASDRAMRRGAQLPIYLIVNISNMFSRI